MDNRQILILLKIGNIDVSQKCINSVSVDRNFSDVGDKFSITLIDSPSTGLLYDLELYMASGYRDITLKYGDISENELVGYTGTIWDYTNTFVGNIKKLTVTGIMSKYTENASGVGNYTYNIDWNSYFNLRRTESSTYGALSALEVRNTLNSKYVKVQEELKNTSMESFLFRPSDILNNEFKDTLYANAKTLSLKGPSGKSIELPIPDCFYYTNKFPSDVAAWMTAIDAGTAEEKEAAIKDYPELYDFVYDPLDRHWGPLVINKDRAKDSASTVAQYLSPYLASSFLVSIKSNKYTRGSYNKNNGFDKATDEITNITSNLLDSLWGCVFPSTRVNGIKLLSKFFINTTAVTDYYNYNNQLGFSGDSKKYQWWNNPWIGNYYGKVNMDMFPSDPSQAGKVPLYKKYHLDNENGGNDVSICTNSAGAVVSFIFWRNGVPRGSFTAIDKEYMKSLSGDTDIRSSSHYSTGISDSTSILHKNYAENVVEYDYFSKKLYIRQNANKNYYFYEKNNVGVLRGFGFVNDPTSDSSTFNIYLQANPTATNSRFGEAGLLASGIGVDISHIVRQLAKLEGWKVRNNDYENTPDIVQTELVSNSELLIMQNQTAMDFIITNLVPHAITPIGEYTLKDGNKEPISNSVAGFYPFFDKDGYFHFQPLTKESITNLKIPNLGYNIPNSPVISFQVNTKGTAFYTYNNLEYNPINIVTGDTSTVDTTISVISDAVSESIAQTTGHNDTFDSWLGLTYNDVEKERSHDDTAETLYQKTLARAKYTLVNSPSTLLLGSSAYDAKDEKTKLLVAKDKINKTVIKATMSLWGNTKICPACNIDVLNMIKGNVSEETGYQLSTPQKHPSSGTYLILSMQDNIDAGGYIQNLNLLRYTDDVDKSINKYNIDYSKKATYTNSWIGPDVFD
jgi:hypothetical protein